MRIQHLAALTLAALVAFPVASSAQTPDYITVALANEARPAGDRARDENRKPGETLAFAGVRPGMQIMDLVPGGGYFTRILSGAVGPEGHVYAQQPSEVVDKFSAYRRVMEALDAEPGWENVTFMFEPVGSFTAPVPLDMVFTALNYHDFHADFMGPADVAAVNRAVFAALKPGGVYVIIDHHALAGAGTTEVNRLHRIEEAVVRREVLAAGFVLDAESDLLANPEDPRGIAMADPSIRGRTDQFILKFRKP